MEGTLRAVFSRSCRVMVAPGVGFDAVRGADETDECDVEADGVLLVLDVYALSAGDGCWSAMVASIRTTAPRGVGAFRTAAQLQPCPKFLDIVFAVAHDVLSELCMTWLSWLSLQRSRAVGAEAGQREFEPPSLHSIDHFCLSSARRRRDLGRQKEACSHHEALTNSTYLSSGPMASRGGLLLASLPNLQNLIKRDPASYTDDFLIQWQHYNALRNIIEQGISTSDASGASKQGGGAKGSTSDEEKFRQLVAFVAQVRARAVSSVGVSVARA